MYTIIYDLTAVSNLEIIYVDNDMRIFIIYNMYYGSKSKKF